MKPLSFEILIAFHDESGKDFSNTQEVGVCVTSADAEAMTERVLLAIRAELEGVQHDPTP